MERRITWQSVLMWVVALLIVNALWLNVAGQTAPNEINTENQFQTHREIDISSVFGNNAPIPAELTTTFSSTSVDQANVSYAIKMNNETVVASWSGDLSSDVPIWIGELEPGRYTIETVVEDGVVVEQDLYLQPFASVQPHGHVVLTLSLVALAWGEQGVRALLAKRSPTTNPIPSEKVPFKSKGFQQEQDSQDWEESDSPWRDPIR